MHACDASNRCESVLAVAGAWSGAAVHACAQDLTRFPSSEIHATAVPGSVTTLLLQGSVMHVWEGATYVSYPARVHRTGCKPSINLILGLLARCWGDALYRCLCGYLFVGSHFCVASISAASLVHIV